jgi:hypothetical protein
MNKYQVSALNKFMSDANLQYLFGELTRRQPALREDLFMHFVRNYYSRAAGALSHTYRTVMDIDSILSDLNKDLIVGVLAALDRPGPPAAPASIGTPAASLIPLGQPNKLMGQQTGQFVDSDLSNIVSTSPLHGYVPSTGYTGVSSAAPQLTSYGHYQRTADAMKNPLLSHVPYNPSTDALMAMWRYPAAARAARDDASGAAGRVDAADVGMAYTTPGITAPKYDNVAVVNNATKMHQAAYRENLTSYDELDASAAYTAAEHVPGTVVQPVDKFLDTTMHKSLNRGKMYQEGTEIVDTEDPEAMRKYAARNIHRTQRRGDTYTGEMVEYPDGTRHWHPATDLPANQIPFWRKNVHNRNLDRDVEENVGGYEFGMHQRGYDRQSQLCRIRGTSIASSAAASHATSVGPRAVPTAAKSAVAMPVIDDQTEKAIMGMKITGFSFQG